MKYAQVVPLSEEEYRMLIRLASVAAATTEVQLHPADDLPGTNVLQHLADGLDSWALIAAVVGIVIGAVIWAFGHYSQNYQQAYNGRKGVMVSALAAVLMGAAPEVINFLFHSGTGAAQ
jgi:type IV secretory pathway VirB2 component (pilin)